MLPGRNKSPCWKQGHKNGFSWTRRCAGSTKASTASVKIVRSRSLLPVCVLYPLPDVASLVRNSLSCSNISCGERIGKRFERETKPPCFGPGGAPMRESQHRNDDTDIEMDDEVSSTV